MNGLKQFRLNHFLIGLFFTPTLVLEEVYNYPDGSGLQWEKDQNFAENNHIMQYLIRNYKHKNLKEKSIYYVVIINLTILGLVLNPN